MKKYESIVKRVQIYEDKCCAEYQKSNGPLFKFLKKAYVLIGIYSVCINLLFIISANMQMSDWKAAGNTEVIAEKHQFILLGICTFTLIASAVLLFTRFKTIGCITGIVTLPFILHVFVAPCTDKLEGFLGFKANFYYENLIPDAVLMILLIWMLVLVLRERILTNYRYRKIEENIYENYREQFDRDEFVVTDEMWENYIKNYDPRAYKNLE